MTFPIHLVLDELDWDPRKALPIALTLGFEAYSLRMMNQNRFPHVPPEDHEWLESLREEEVCRFDVITPGVNKDLYDAAAATRLLREDLPLCLERATRLDCPSISLFSWAKPADAPAPASPDELSPGMPFEAITETLQRACEQAERADVGLTIEVGYQCWCDTGLGAAKLIRAVNHPRLQMLWDPCNSLSGRTWWQRRLPAPASIGDPMTILLDELHAIAPLIDGVHVRDEVLTPGDWRYVLLGEGDVKWPVILQALVDAGYSGAVTVEHHIPAPDKERATRHTIAQLRTILAGLRPAQAAGAAQQTSEGK